MAPINTLRFSFVLFFLSSFLFSYAFFALGDFSTLSKLCRLTKRTTTHFKIYCTVWRHISPHSVWMHYVISIGAYRLGLFNFTMWTFYQWFLFLVPHSIRNLFVDSVSLCVFLFFWYRPITRKSMTFSEVDSCNCNEWICQFGQFNWKFFHVSFSMTLSVVSVHWKFFRLLTFKFSSFHKFI